MFPTKIVVIGAGTGGLVKKGNPKNVKSMDDVCGLTAAAGLGTVEEAAFRDQGQKCVAAGKPAVVNGELRVAQGSGKLPTVVLIHGSSGVGPNIELWVRDLNAMGISTFVIDGFTGRLNFIEHGGFSAFIVMAHTNAIFSPPGVGGILLEAAAGDFRIDHDQKFNSTTNLQYVFDKRVGAWAALSWR